MKRLVLASGSPRRLELLRHLTTDFTIAASDIEERGSDWQPAVELAPVALPPSFHIEASRDPRLWAWRKALDVAQSQSNSESNEVVVLGADTVVVAPGELLGKPCDLDDARRMLNLLRGREHYVVTGFAILAPQSPPGPVTLDAVITRAVMRRFSEEELEGYVATGEPLDKAGAYALQGLGGRLVARVEGCVTNVVGLPLCQVRRGLLSAGLELLPYPKEGYCAYCPLNE